MAVVTPDLPEIFEEAFERAGLEMRSGYDLKTARRSLNILTLEWQNRGINSIYYRVWYIIFIGRNSYLHIAL